MIRILHSVSNMDRAGIETMLMNYYRNIDRSQVQFDFLCNKTKPGAYDEEILDLGGRIFHTPGLNPLVFMSYQHYMGRLFAEHPEYRILHGHNGAFAVYSLYAAKCAKIPVRIFHGHDTNLTRDLKYPLKIFCMQFMEQNINHRFACGVEAARFYYGDKVVQEGSFRVLPNAIDVDKFVFKENVREYMREKHNLQNRKVIGHIGRFMHQKNHEFLLNIFAKLHQQVPEVFLVLLGDGELMPAVKRQAQALGIFQDVMFVGNVPNANEWYQAFDMFLLPSHYEGLPVVGIEAQAAGLPVIFADTITKEIAFNEQVKYIRLYSSIDQWTKEIINSLKQTERPDNFSLITDNNYNIRLEAVKLQKLYQKLYEENLNDI